MHIYNSYILVTIFNIVTRYFSGEIVCIFIIISYISSFLVIIVRESRLQIKINNKEGEEKTKKKTKRKVMKVNL